MSLPALTAYLSLQEPGHTIDSAYALEQKYRLAAQTVISQLHAHHYVHQAVAPTISTIVSRTDGSVYTYPATQSARTVWVKQETQLDRIERKLNLLLNSHA